jgi:hypothetical protein
VDDVVTDTMTTYNNPPSGDLLQTDLDKTKPAFTQPILVGLLALAIGVVADGLAFHSYPGVGLALSFTLATLALSATAMLIGASQPVGLAPSTIVGVTISLCIALQVSPVLLTLNILTALAVMMVLAQLAQDRGDTGDWTIKRYLD